jgi:hypothetical protein
VVNWFRAYVSLRRAGLDRFQLIRRLDGAYSNTLLSLAVARARSTF